MKSSKVTKSVNKSVNKSAAKSALKSSPQKPLPPSTLIIFWVVLLLLTIFSRFYELTNKPIHFDEGINGWFVSRMFETGFYKYDPSNYHGPLLFYLMQLFESVWGSSLEVLRSVPAVFNVLAVMIFGYQIVRSRTWNYWMIFFILLSPAFLFYGRSAIHEMPFVFFQMLMALGFMRWLEKQDGKALALVVVGAVGMITLKETFVLSFGCWFVAFLALGWTQLKESFAPQALVRAWSRPLTLLTLVLLCLLVGLFCGFGKNPQGLADFFKAFLPWLKTGVEGHGHDKPFAYWFQVVVAAEPLVLAGMLCSVWGIFSRDRALRLLSVFSLLQFFIYSLIPYKTVWCILTLVWGFYFVLAMSVEKFMQARKAKWWVVLALIVAMPAELESAYTAVYRDPIDMEHPFVYVNSTYDFKALLGMIEQVLADHPDLKARPIQIGMKEQWPLPWALRMSHNLHYDLCSDLVVDNALVYFAENEDAVKVEAHLTKEYLKVPMDTRQARGSSLIYLDREVFQNYYKGKSAVVGHVAAPVSADTGEDENLLEEE